VGQRASGTFCGLGLALIPGLIVDARNHGSPLNPPHFGRFYAHFKPEALLSLYVETCLE